VEDLFSGAGRGRKRKERGSSIGLSGLEIVREGIRSGTRPPIAELIGFDLRSAKRGLAVIEMVAGPQHANPMGTLHGGVICDISDAATGIAYVTTLAAGETFATMELKVNFLRPFWTGRITARANVLRKGRTTGFMVCKVLDETGNLVAYATSTCITIRGADDGLTRERREDGSAVRHRTRVRHKKGRARDASGN
jgi:uncharacterized protein (TIGR00369 family)